MDELLKQDREFLWTDDCHRMFVKAKEILCSDLLLTHYDPAKPVIVAADASNNGIGATISHLYPDGTQKVIEHAARALTSAEKNYSQIEKEALGLIFAVKKFHKYIYGRKFKLLTDHRPLLSIFGSKKGIPVYAASRLQRWALILLNYDFHIDYVKTDDFGNADVLSRLIDEHRQQTDDEMVIASVDCHVESILSAQCNSLPITSAEIAEETSKDDILMEVMTHLQRGWPKKISTGYLKPYFDRQVSLSCVNRCLVSGERVIIPTVLRPKILKTLHLGHPEVVRMKALARIHVYWPGIDADIERLVRQCSSCAFSAKSPVKAPLHPWTPEHQPWKRIHMDFAGPFLKKMFLLVVDVYSKWLEIVVMDMASTLNVLNGLKVLMARYGYPSVIVTDNGTQFTSREFGNYCAARGIQHVRTAPYHPQSNGQAERFVDTFKRTVSKLRMDGTTVMDAVCEYLRTYRSTPSAVLDGKSPAELFLGRRLNTEINLVHPDGNVIKSVNNARQNYNNNMSKNFNKHHGVKRRKFHLQDLVYYRFFREGTFKWLPGTIVRRVGSVLYAVRTDDNFTVIKHINHLRARTNSLEAEKSLLLPMEPMPLPLNPEFPPCVSDGHVNGAGNNVAAECVEQQRPIRTNSPVADSTPLSYDDRTYRAPVAPNVVETESEAPAVRRSIRQRQAPKRLIMSQKNKAYQYERQ